MMFTSISAGYDTGYDAGYDAALLVLSFPCAAFPFLFPLQVTIFHAPLSLETPTPSWMPLFIFRSSMSSNSAAFQLFAWVLVLLQSFNQQWRIWLLFYLCMLWLRHYTLVWLPKSLIGVQILSCEWSCSDESAVFNLWPLQDAKRALRTINEIMNFIQV